MSVSQELKKLRKKLRDYFTGKACFIALDTSWGIAGLGKERRKSYGSWGCKDLDGVSYCLVKGLGL